VVRVEKMSDDNITITIDGFWFGKGNVIDRRYVTYTGNIKIRTRTSVLYTHTHTHVFVENGIFLVLIRNVVFERECVRTNRNDYDDADISFLISAFAVMKTYSARTFSTSRVCLRILVFRNFPRIAIDACICHIYIFPSTK